MIDQVCEEQIRNFDQLGRSETVFSRRDQCDAYVAQLTGSGTSMRETTTLALTVFYLLPRSSLVLSSPSTSQQHTPCLAGITLDL